MVDLGGPNFDSTSRAILREARISGVRLTDLAARLLSETARCLKYKNSHADELSSTSYVLTAFIYDQNTQERSEELEDLRYVLESAGLEKSDLEQMSDDFFSEPPAVPAVNIEEYNLKAAIGATLGPGLRQALRTWKVEEPLSVPALVQSLLEDQGSGISERVKKILDMRRASIASEEAAAPVVLGARPTITSRSNADPTSQRRHVRIVREATLDELGLNAIDYAKALATILRVSEGEFSFALFGAWGSGKTTLLRLLKPLLESPAEYRNNVKVPKAETYPDLRYRVVVHNAWKYRAPPESWVYLYKSLATAVTTSAGPLERWALALRVATDRNGSIAVLASLVLLALSLIPIQAKLQLLSLLASAVGLSTLIYAASIWMGASNKVRQLFHRNLNLVGRDENLGMLALIGDDVRFLMKGWTKDRGPSWSWRDPIIPVACIAAISIIWAIVLLQRSSFDLATFARWIGVSWKEAASGPSVVDATHWLILVIWTGLALLLVILPKFARERRPDKVLLVVDDLDRCSPTEMLSVIENVRLLLDDDEINRRLQVLMLVDEHVLNHAIALRYETMIEDRAKRLNDAAKSEAMNGIVQEQIEKLFACHLRMSRLSDDDVVELVTKLAGHENEKLKKEEAVALERQRRDAEGDLHKAAELVASLQEQYEEVAAGKPLRRVDEEGPSRHQWPAADRMRMGDHTPKGIEEKRQANVQNERIDAANRATASMTREERLAGRKDVVEALDGARSNEAARRQALEALPPIPTQLFPKPTETPFETGDVRFSDDEIEKLRVFMPHYFRTARRRPSPRSIKALLFKLQLARLLMQLRYPDLENEEARMEELLKAFQKEATNPPKENESLHTLIVRQVL
ncbi:P-loop NTPase fold protein [Bradyrhizobium sp. ma5]|uniref:P-loop NTPase fold protein n=1 Tax=Bradyrhizobium sp. ma5 TaxID=3344828 RepID=UPI0035D49C9D